MKHFEKYKIHEDSDLDNEIWPKPVVKTHVIRLAVFCVFVVVFVAGVVWKIVNG